jgi:hypothetical protein
MKGRVRWSQVTIALALIAAAAIAAPAIGGSSATTAVTVSKKTLKKLIKKEVSKQIAKATGPSGPQGPTGPSGSQGPAGTARAYAVINPTNCTATPGSCGLIKAKNVVGARRPQQGFYCVTVGAGINRLTDGHMAGVEWGETPGVPGNASAMPFALDEFGGSVCPGGEFTVATERLATATTTTNANDVAFWFAIP